ncbi:MAG: S8 family serine peptidase [Nitrospiraceae bacterium]|nr:S8 family serine peptidase [Nitrospiraceae bacterium]
MPLLACNNSPAGKVLWGFVLCTVLIFPSLLLAGERPGYGEGVVLVKFRGGYAGDASTRRQEALSAMGMRIMRRLPLIDSYLVRLSSVEPAVQAVKRLKTLQDVEYAEPNYERKLLGVIPNDPLFGAQWGHLNIQSPDAWQISTGGHDVVIAVADSGVDYTHRDLQANIWGGRGYNAITGTNDPMDDEGHGTHVAGIIGAAGNNGIGVAGVNWTTSIMALKFVGPDGTGTVAEEIDAIGYAKDHGAMIFNMSYGSNDFSTFEMEAIQNAGEILFLAAAGNEAVNNDMVPIYPANYDLPNIISVAASDQSDQPAFFSNFGRNTVSVSAPGIDILSTVPGNGYESMSGTSMSVAFVSGLAGLVLAAKPGLTVSQLKDQLLRTADVLQSLKGLSLTGGRINAHRALSTSVTGPYIYAISPERGPAGAEVTIRGSRFKAAAGTVVFSNNLNAPIVSWSNEKVVAEVPDGAVAGHVYVVTSEGKSNEVDFEVTPYPTNVSLSFPHVPLVKGHYSLFVVSNPLERPVTIYMNVVEMNEGERTLKTVVLNKFEKRIIDVTHYGPAEDSLFIECESLEFFGAAAILVPEDGGGVLALPPLIGGPMHLVGGITPR